MPQNTPLIDSIKFYSENSCRQTFDKIVALLENDPTLVNERDIIGSTPLHWTAFYNLPDITLLLINFGADINARDINDVQCPITYPDPYNNTALHEAASHGHKDVVRVLINKGADISILNASDETALKIAQRKGFKDTVAAIISPKEEVKPKGSTEQQNIIFTSAPKYMPSQEHVRLKLMELKKATGAAPKIPGALSRKNSKKIG